MASLFIAVWKSAHVIGRLSGGPNLTPGLSLNVQVMALFVIVGRLAARSGTGTLPGAPGSA